MPSPVDIVPVLDAAQHAAARELITEYLQWVADAAARQGGLRFDTAAMLAGDLGAGEGLYLVRDAGEFIGVGRLQRLDAGVAEVQRMYVRPSARRRGGARLLLERLLADARAAGCRCVRLESLRFLEAAHALYRSVGFQDIAPYDDNSMKHYQDADSAASYPAHAVFMELALADEAPRPVDLAAKLATFEGHWQPRTVVEYNGHDVMVVKVQGDYHWHSHPDTDDFFLVLQGELHIDLAGGRTITLGPGQMHVVPRGQPHRPRAPQEAHLLLIEPTGTPNSGDAATAAPRRVI
ncbi:MAG: GNAT family N-acetyltransferase [Ramlibacter sp.]|nr:GNAT family N-acetyltransferase [Ramlibacter sp.]